MELASPAPNPADRKPLEEAVAPSTEECELQPEQLAPSSDDAGELYSTVLISRLGTNVVSHLEDSIN